MKKISFRLVSLVLALALCLLPTVAGAVYKLDRDKLEFTVGEYKEQRFWYTCDPEAPTAIGWMIPPHGCSECGLNVEGRMDGGMHAMVYGTPTKAGDCSASLIIKFKNEQGKEETVTLSIPIIIREKGTPVAPAPAPVERPEVVDYSRCEQAFIRGVKEWCNIRQRADINSDVIGRATLGQRISLICWNEDETWCYVDCGGEQGWIAKQFILPIK